RCGYNQGTRPRPAILHFPVRYHHESRGREPSRDRRRTLASGDAGQEVEEAHAKLAGRLHRTFKVKIGAQEPEADMARMRHLSRALEGVAELIVDGNQARDETVASRCLPVLEEMGVRLVEQPVPA